MADYTYRARVCSVDFGEIVSKVSRAHENAGKQTLACPRCHWRKVQKPQLEKARNQEVKRRRYA